MGVNNSSISVFKLFFIHKIVVHEKIRKNRKNPKNLKKSNKFKDFFEDLKSVQLIWELTTPRFQYLNYFLFIKSSYTKKSEKIEKIRKIWKNPINSRIFLRIWNPYNLFGSELSLAYRVASWQKLNRYRKGFQWNSVENDKSESSYRKMSCQYSKRATPKSDLE